MGKEDRSQTQTKGKKEKSRIYPSYAPQDGRVYALNFKVCLCSQKLP